MNISQLSLLLYPVQFICRPHGQCYIRDDPGRFFMIWSDHRVSALVQYSLDSSVNARLKVDNIITEEIRAPQTPSLQEMCKGEFDCQNSTCRDDRCTCGIGYSFDDELKICRNLNGCRSFSDSFVGYTNTKLVSERIPYKRTKFSFERCQRSCVKSKVTCRAITVQAQIQMCSLWKAFSKTRKLSQIFGAVYYERPCDWKR